MRKILALSLAALTGLLAAGCNDDNDPGFVAYFTTPYVIQENDQDGNPVSFTPWVALVAAGGTIESASLTKNGGTVAGKMREYRYARYYETLGTTKYNSIAEVNGRYVAEVVSTKGDEKQPAFTLNFQPADVMGRMTVNSFTYDYADKTIRLETNAVTAAKNIGLYIVCLYNNMESGTRISSVNPFARYDGSNGQQTFSFTLSAEYLDCDNLLVYPAASNGGNASGGLLFLLGEGKRLRKEGQNFENI